MITIAIVGESGDNALSYALFRRLRENCSVTYIRDARILHDGSVGEEILLYDATAIDDFSVKSGLIVIEKGGRSLLSGELPTNTAVIVHSDDARLLGKAGLAPIICGGGNKDTISFSSRSDEDVVVALQRAVTSFSGEVIEPFELPLSRDGDDDFTLLAYVGVCAKIGFANGRKL